jgi:hypothetical protein
VINIAKAIIKNSYSKARVYLREPVSVTGERLTLKDHYSDELKECYNAIYRTEEEFDELFFSILQKSGFKIIGSDFLYQEKELNNRKETRQKYYYLEKI